MKNIRMQNNIKKPLIEFLRKEKLYKYWLNLKLFFCSFQLLLYVCAMSTSCSSKYLSSSIVGHFQLFQPNEFGSRSGFAKKSLDLKKATDRAIPATKLAHKFDFIGQFSQLFFHGEKLKKRRGKKDIIFIVKKGGKNIKERNKFFHIFSYSKVWTRNECSHKC